MTDQTGWKKAFEEARAQALNVDAYTFQIAWAYALATPTPDVPPIALAGEPVAWLIERDDALSEATAAEEYARLAERNGARVTPLIAAPSPSASSVPVAWIEQCEMDELKEAAAMRFGVSAVLYPEEGDPNYNFVPLYAAPPSNAESMLTEDSLHRMIRDAGFVEGDHPAGWKRLVVAILQANGATK